MTQPIWNTPAGSLGLFPNGKSLSIYLSASVQWPAHTLAYKFLNGSLPDKVSISVDGVITGIPDSVSVDTEHTFTVRVTDELMNIRDRTFKLTVTGSAIPYFTIPDSSLLTTLDSIWVDLPITYTNIDPNNIVTISLAQGRLPPGLELNSAGLIQGYAEPPIVNVRLNSISTVSTLTTAGTNLITCNSTSGFVMNRAVVFTGAVLGTIAEGVTYYIREIVSTTAFTISTTPGGDVVSVTSDNGIMSVDLPSTSVGEATINTFSFTLRLSSALGGEVKAYSITVVNQNATVSQGGPGKAPNTRSPVIINTRPRTQALSATDPYYGYYILPTVSPTTPALIGTVVSGEYFAFKVNGFDFDSSVMVYSYSSLPLGLEGHPNTGWITGYPVIASGISQFSFSVSVHKEIVPTITSVYHTFAFNLTNGILNDVTWKTLPDLGAMFNGEVSTLSVNALADVPLSYRIVSGYLPPNLILLSNGEISGNVANQPTDTFLNVGESTVFTVTIQAYSNTYSLIKSDRTFTITVNQEYSLPTDIIYIKATPSISDRQIITSLLSDETLIPTSSIYRAGDIYFGKSSAVVYEHLYGILASDISEYIASVTKNHYWRNITLGEIKTAVAKNKSGEVIYEVVYSEVIDNLANMNAPESTSMLLPNKTNVYWETPIDLLQGPWYTSISNIFTSYVFEVNGAPSFFTSLSSGFASLLYPNSLSNMRAQVTSELGKEYTSKLLPLWMTSQQPNGSTLGYTQAWVISYMVPGTAEAVKNAIQTQWPHKLNQINFRIDRLTVDKSTTFNYDKNMSPPAWTNLPSGQPVPEPLDTNNFHVLFPRRTILPDEAQY